MSSNTVEYLNADNINSTPVSVASPLPVSIISFSTTPVTFNNYSADGFAAGGSNQITIVNYPYLLGVDGNMYRARGDTNGSAIVGIKPLGAAIGASSGNVANASAVATLAGVAGKTTYITGFQVTASGATAGLPVTVTVAGLLGGTQSFTFVFPAGALVAAQPLIVSFPTPLPASAVNTAIVVTLPASGAGGTNATCNAQGFQL